MTLKGKLATVFDSSSGGAGGSAGSGSSASSGGGANAANLNKAGTAKKLVMRIQAFSLEPRVNVLENLTPYAVNKVHVDFFSFSPFLLLSSPSSQVFELLKIGDPQQMIPDAVHSGLTVNAEKLLFAIKDAFMRLDEVYAPKKKAPPAASPSSASASSGTPSVPRIVMSTPGTQRMPIVPTAKASNEMSPGSAGQPRSKSGLGKREKESCNFFLMPLTGARNAIHLSSAMPRLTPSLSRLEAKPLSKEDEDKMFSLLDEDFN